MTDEAKRQYTMGQMLIFSLHALRDHASIVSGAYKRRRTRKGINPEKRPVLLSDEDIHLIFPDPDTTPHYCPTCHFHINDQIEQHCCGITWVNGVATWRDMTDEELLEQEMGVLNRHIEWVTDCNEALAKIPTE